MIELTIFLYHTIINDGFLASLVINKQLSAYQNESFYSYINFKIGCLKKVTNNLINW